MENLAEKIEREIRDRVKETDLFCGGDFFSGIWDWQTAEIVARERISKAIKEGNLKLFGKSYDELQPEVRDYIDENYSRYKQKVLSE